jgi:hypothetical protein
VDVVINAVDVREFLFSKQVRKIAKMRLTGIAIVAKVKANKSSVVDFELVEVNSAKVASEDVPA